jgi:hypothetical protein
MTWPWSILWAAGMGVTSFGWAQLIRSWFFHGGKDAEHRSNLLFGVGGTMLTAWSLLAHQSPLLTAWCAVNGILGFWFWWRNRRNRKRAPRAYGAKSAALLAALVKRAREAAKPRPVLRPVPGMLATIERSAAEVALV